MTGYYEFTDVRAKILDSKEFGVEAGASSTFIGAPTGAGIGTLGPFKDGKTIKADISMPGSAIWAARFYKVNVDYHRISAKGDTTLPVNTIKLSRIITNLESRVRGGNLMSPNRAVVGIEDPQELSENDAAE